MVVADQDVQVARCPKKSRRQAGCLPRLDVIQTATRGRSKKNGRLESILAGVLHRHKLSALGNPKFPDHGKVRPEADPGVAPVG